MFARKFDLKPGVESLAIQPGQNAELGFCDRHKKQMELRKSILTCISPFNERKDSLI